MAPFTRGPCPGCRQVTTHHFLIGDEASGDDLWSICDSCFTVFTKREDGSVVQRPATEAEREVVPPPVVWSDEEKAEWRESYRQGRADLRAWFDKGCPGLTPEIEAAFRPGTLDRVRQLVERPDFMDIFPEVEPPRGPESASPGPEQETP